MQTVTVMWWWIFEATPCWRSVWSLLHPPVVNEANVTDSFRSLEVGCRSSFLLGIGETTLIDADGDIVRSSSASRISGSNKRASDETTAVAPPVCIASGCSPETTARTDISVNRSDVWFVLFSLHYTQQGNKARCGKAHVSSHTFLCELSSFSLVHWSGAYSVAPASWLHLPLRTCTRTLATSALDGEQEYLPESSRSAFWISRCEVVTSPFSVMTETPPRLES